MRETRAFPWRVLWPLPVNLHCGMMKIVLLSTLLTSVAENVAETELTGVGEGESGKRPGSDEVRL